MRRVNIARAFTLQVVNPKSPLAPLSKTFSAGVQDVTEDEFDHWFLQANLVSAVPSSLPMPGTVEAATMIEEAAAAARKVVSDKLAEAASARAQANLLTRPGIPDAPIQPQSLTLGQAEQQAIVDEANRRSEEMAAAAVAQAEADAEKAAADQAAAEAEATRLLEAEAEAAAQEAEAAAAQKAADDAAALANANKGKGKSGK